MTTSRKLILFGTPGAVDVPVAGWAPAGAVAPRIRLIATPTAILAPTLVSRVIIAPRRCRIAEFVPASSTPNSLDVNLFSLPDGQLEGAHTPHGGSSGAEISASCDDPSARQIGKTDERVGDLVLGAERRDRRRSPVRDVHRDIIRIVGGSRCSHRHYR